MSKKNCQSLSQTNFQITTFNLEDVADIKNYLKNIKHYQASIAVQEICPKTGKKHVHIFVQYSRSVRLSLKKLKGGHLENTLGSAQQNLKYVKKNLNKDAKLLWEEGSFEEKGKKGGKSIRDLKNMSKEEREDLPMNYFNIVSKINKEESNLLSVKDFRKTVKVFYIWGPSGVGKTNWALSKMEELGIEKFNDVKFTGSFWNGISENCDCALYDDFRDSHMKPSEFINFIDYNVHNLNSKGGYYKNKYKFIFITSIQSPENLWADFREKNPEDSLTQWMRRMEVVRLGEEEEKKEKFKEIVEDDKPEFQNFINGYPDSWNDDPNCNDPFDLENYK